MKYLCFDDYKQLHVILNMFFVVNTRKKLINRELYSNITMAYRFELNVQKSLFSIKETSSF